MAAAFGIHPDEIASIVRGRDYNTLSSIGGVEAVAGKLRASVDEGVSEESINRRQQIYGVNYYTVKLSRTFLMFFWDALGDFSLKIHMFLAVIAVGRVIDNEGWQKGTYYGVGMILSVLLAVIVTAVWNTHLSPQYRGLDKEKNQIFVLVTRDGKRQKISIYNVVVGDIVHLSPSDQVPADGIYLSGYMLLIDESSLSGESEPVNVNEEKPFLLSGTKVQDGLGKMLVTTVGMRTEWGILMETPSKGEVVATTIGKIGLGFAVLTFLVLTIKYLVEQAHRRDSNISDNFPKVNGLDAIAVTIIGKSMTALIMTDKEMQLLKDFYLNLKNTCVEALRLWRSAVSLVKNRWRWFQMVPDIENGLEAEQMKEEIKIWRVVGLASNVVGMFCYALSPAFTHLIGGWNTFKIALHVALALIIFTAILFGKQGSLPLRGKVTTHLQVWVFILINVFTIFL